MSQTEDDYALPNENLSLREDVQDSEPADPDVTDHAARSALPIAPSSVKVRCLPEPLVQSGRAVTVAEARTIYTKIQLSNIKAGSLTSKHERHKHSLYPRILNADREL